MSEPFRLSFRIDKLPPSLSNGSHGHWRTRAGIKKAWQQLTVWHCNGKTPLEPLSGAKAIFTRHSSFEPDYDNLVSSFKAIQDGLVRAGVLVDDKPSVLSAQYLWKKTSPKNGYVSIEVEEQMRGLA